MLLKVGLKVTWGPSCEGVGCCSEGVKKQVFEQGSDIMTVLERTSLEMFIKSQIWNNEAWKKHRGKNKKLQKIKCSQEQEIGDTEDS